MDEKIITLQKEIRAKQQELVTLRLKQPLEEVSNYDFKDKNGKTVSLDSLFKGKDELLVIHNMGKACKYCTMWADGFRGFTDIINDRMPWILTSPDAPEILKEFAEKRNWNFNYLSYNGTNFAHNLGFAHNKENRTFYQPGVSALIKKDGKIYRTAKDFFGPGDLYNPAWHFYDLFPKGVDGWQPKYTY